MSADEALSAIVLAALLWYLDELVIGLVLLLLVLGGLVLAVRP